MHVLSRFRDEEVKSLSFAEGKLYPSDLQGLRHHGSLERLVLARAASDPGLISLFQSIMPHLRDVAVSVCDDEKMGREAFEKSLREALPDCRCCVLNDER